MTIMLRPYQLDVESQINDIWKLRPLANILAVIPTGGGKTVLFAKIMQDEPGACCAIAHRQELVSQISVALARNGVYHRIIAPEKVIKMIVRLHMVELGESFHNPGAKAGVAGVDTLTKRQGRYAQWLNSVKLWVQDEAHHVLKKNKWGTAASMFPNARGLGVTATPCRADGAGLGRHVDGLFDHMVIGPSMRTLINEKYLTEYRIFAPPNNLDLTKVDISKSTGDYNKNQMRDAVKGSSLVVSDGKSRVVGDVVKHYLKIAPGKLGVTFVPNVEIAHDIAAQFNLAGVPAAAVSAKTPDEERAAILTRFKNRELLQLVNCDLFGEGFDLPAIEVVSMARPTQSFGLYVQQFGRALRLLEGKLFAIIIDHVGNVDRHGLPDARREWSLDRRERSSGGGADDVTPVKTCIECMAVYERFIKECPYCGHVNIPAIRSGPEYVDGDLFELDAMTLAALRGEVDKVDMPFDEQVAAYKLELAGTFLPQRLQFKHAQSFSRKLKLKTQSVELLRDCFAWWAGHHRHSGRTNDEIYRIFYLTFDVDWYTAQTLDGKGLDKLIERIALNTSKIG